MAATIDSKWVTVGAAKYPRRIVSLQMVPVGQFLEARLIAAGALIDTCSNDSASTNYQNSIFGKTTPESVFEVCSSSIRVMGELKIAIPPSIILGEGNTFTYTKANHSFPVPSVVAWNGTDWIAADKDNTLDVFVIVSATTNTFTVGLPGCHEVNHQLGSAPGLFYLGDPPSNLTRTAVPVGQTPKKQLVLGQILDSTHLWIQPEWRAT